VKKAACPAGFRVLHRRCPSSSLPGLSYDID
jgi:hypothetical protein